MRLVILIVSWFLFLLFAVPRQVTAASSAANTDPMPLRQGSNSEASIAAVARGNSIGFDEIHGMSLANADARQDVEFEAVSYYCDPDGDYLFVGNESKFVLLKPSVGCNDLGDISAGRRLRIKGRSAAGQRTPYVEADTVQILGEAQLTLPTSVRLDEVALAEVFSPAWIEFRARVIQIEIKNRTTVCRCLAGDNALTVNLPHRLSVENAARLIDASVLIEGNVGGDIFRSPAASEEAPGLVVDCPSNELRVLAEADNSLTIATQTPLNVAIQLGHRQPMFATTGQVTFVRPAGFYVEDDSAAAWIHLPIPMSIPAGAHVAVFGYYRTSPSQTHFEGRLFVHRKGRPLIQLSPTAANTITAVRHEGKRVAVRGVLQDMQLKGPYVTLLMESNSIPYRAHLPATATGIKSLDLRNAHDLIVTGTCSFVDRQTAGSGQRFDLFVPSIANIQLVSRNTQIGVESLIAVGLLASMLVISFAWAKSLRVQVNAKTRDLAESAAKLRCLFDSVRDGLLMIDERRQIVAANESLCRQFAIRIDADEPLVELTNRIAKKVNNQELLAEWNRLNQGSDDVFESVVELVGPNSRSLEVFSAPVRNETCVIGRLWAFHEVTERNELLGTLAHAQKQEAIGRLAGGVAHDFNNVLTCIISSLAAARLDIHQPGADLESYLTTAESAAQHAASVVKQLLGFSRKVVLDVLPLNLNKLLINVRALLGAELANAIVNFRFDPGLPAVKGDRTQLEQAFLNLILNSLYAIRESGELTIQTSVKIIVRNTETVAKRYAVVTIRDTGCGMPQEVRQRIFDPFFTTKPVGSGTGLGLPMVDGIVDQHGGWIECDSVVNAGTEFRVYMPATSDREQLHEAPTPSVNLFGKRILVADDDPIVRTVICQLLERYGIRVSRAENGEQAIRCVEGNARLDLVLLDWRMPAGSGRETLAAIRRISPDLPIVVCSGFTVEVERQLPSAEFAPDGLISKPFRSEQLVEEIGRVLETRGIGYEA